MPKYKKRCWVKNSERLQLYWQIRAKGLLDNDKSKVAAASTAGPSDEAGPQIPENKEANENAEMLEMEVSGGEYFRVPIGDSTSADDSKIIQVIKPGDIKPDPDGEPTQETGRKRKPPARLSYPVERKSERPKKPVEPYQVPRKKCPRRCADCKWLMRGSVIFKCMACPISFMCKDCAHMRHPGHVVLQLPSAEVFDKIQTLIYLFKKRIIQKLAVNEEGKEQKTPDETTVKVKVDNPPIEEATIKSPLPEEEEAIEPPQDSSHTTSYPNMEAVDPLETPQHFLTPGVSGNPNYINFEIPSQSDPMPSSIATFPAINTPQKYPKPSQLMPDANIGRYFIPIPNNPGNVPTKILIQPSSTLYRLLTHNVAANPHQMQCTEMTVPPNTSLQPNLSQHIQVPPNVSQQMIAPPNVSQQMIVPPNVSQQMIVPPNALQQMIVPPNILQQMIVPPNALQQMSAARNPLKQKLEMAVQPMRTEPEVEVKNEPLEEYVVMDDEADGRTP